MQATSIDLDPQQLLQPDIGQADLAAEVIDQRKLTGFVRSLERHPVEAERDGEAIGKGSVEVALVVEEADALCGFARLDHDLDRASVEPAIALGNQCIDHIRSEGAVVLLAELELHLKSALAGHLP